jgi:hypothetical protein
MWQDGTTELARLKHALEVFDTNKGYQQLDDAFGHPFPSFRAFCIAKPPHGLGYDPVILDMLQRDLRQITLGELLAEIDPLPQHGGDHKSEEYQDRRVYLEKSGRDSRYRLARLKRDHAPIAEALERGEYPSVRAACKAAGFVRDPTPLDYLHRYWRQVAPDDRLRFLVEMLTPNERRALQFGLEDEESPHA